MNWLYGAVAVLVGLAAAKWLFWNWCVRNRKELACIPGIVLPVFGLAAGVFGALFGILYTVQQNHKINVAYEMRHESPPVLTEVKVYSTEMEQFGKRLAVLEEWQKKQPVIQPWTPKPWEHWQDPMPIYTNWYPLPIVTNYSQWITTNTNCVITAITNTMGITTETSLLCCMDSNGVPWFEVHQTNKTLWLDGDIELTGKVRKVKKEARDE